MQTNNTLEPQLRISTVRRFSLRFSLLVAGLIMLFSAGSLLLLRATIRGRQDQELMIAAQAITRLLAHSRLHDADTELPYYIMFTVYDNNSHDILATNDPFLPLLPITPHRAKRYTAKQYFLDGDLNILYYAVYAGKGDLYTIQTALNMDTDTAESIIAGLPRILALMSIPLLVLSYIAVFFIAKRMLHSVRVMTEAAQKISSSNLNVRLPVTDKKDGFYPLAKTLNDLLNRLQADFERERQFTADVSHELKTPLAVILGHANLLRRWGKDDPVRLEKSLAALIREAHSMEAIVSNLLQMTRLENGTLPLNKHAVYIAWLFERLISDTVAYAPGVRFTQSVQAAVLNTDEELLYQACTIIISNSVKFAGGQSHISLAAYYAGRERNICVFELSDDGPGIEAAALPHVFERFYRGDAAHARSAGGAGLGLPIVKSIMQALGGSVQAVSIPGAGARITLVFPAG